MKKLYDAVQRFCARHPRFGIPNLMLYIVAGNVIVYLLMMFTQRADANALAFLSLNTAAVLRGELWRIVTYVFVPGSSNLFMLLISLYFWFLNFSCYIKFLTTHLSLNLCYFMPDHFLLLFYFSVEDSR